MKIETIKTYILTILVSISILLTFAIWNYQPNYDFLYNDQTEDVNEIDLGGSGDKTKQDIVEPVSIVFHSLDSHYGFTSLNEQSLFYRNMGDWVLDDPRLGSVGEGPPNDNYQVEMVFSQSLPAQIIRNLFIVDEEYNLPNWSFKRLYIILDHENSSLKVHFIASNNQQQLTFRINDVRAYNDVWLFFQADERLESYVVFDASEEPIYIRANKFEMRRQTFEVKKISPSEMVNELFVNKDDVKPNFGEQYYTDGQRGMRILERGHLMEFINPIHSIVDHTEPLELLDRSVANINGHHGWTNDYRLASIDVVEDSIRYRMFFNGYPIYSNNDLSIIEQSWANQKLHLYSRPLFSLNNLFATDTIELAAGKDILFYLENNENYSAEQIQDIQVGYYLSYSDNSEDSVTLKPAWFMKYNGNWFEISLEELDEFSKGGG